MEQGVDFTIELFRLLKRGPRCGKGKAHNYLKLEKMVITQL